MNLVHLPLANVNDLPSCLRNLADGIERGDYGKATHIAWVMDTEYQAASVGLIGMAANPDAVAVMLFEIGKASLIKRMGK